MTGAWTTHAAGGTTGVLTVLLALGASSVAGAQTPIQTIFQEQADSLRQQLVCAPDTVWPSLPKSPTAVSIEAAVDSTGSISYFVGDGIIVSTTVQLPQYAYFFNPSNETCEPVIVLETDAVGNLVYSRPLAKTAGVAPVVFFDLLGSDPPVPAESD